MRDAMVMQIVEGTNEVRRVIVAREWFRSFGEDRRPVRAGGAAAGRGR